MFSWVRKFKWPTFGRRQAANQAQNFTIEYWYKLNFGVEFLIEILLIILHNKIPVPTYKGLPTNGQQLNQLMVLLKQHKQRALKKFIHANQWDLLCPPNSQTSDSDTWDVTLICAVIKNWPKNIPQLNNYLQLPQHLLDLVDEIRELRNKIKHGCLRDFQDQQEFQQLWNDLRSIIVRGGFPNLNEFDSLGSETILPNKVVQFLRDELFNLQLSFDLKLKDQNDVTARELSKIPVQIKSQNDATTKELAAVQGKLDRLEKELEQLPDSSQYINAIPDEIMQQMEKFSNTYNSIKSKVDQLEERLGDVENVVLDAKDKIDYVEEVVDNVKNTINNVKENMDDRFCVVHKELGVVNDRIEKLEEKDNNEQKCKENNIKELKDRVKGCKEMIKEEYLETLLRKPLLDPRGNTTFHEKDFQDLFVDLAIIKDRYVDKKALVSDREYHATYLEAKKKFIFIKDIASMKEKCIFVQGIAGIGKSMLVRKLVTEWYEDRLFNGENGGTKIHLLLPILCRELNRLNVDSNAGLDDILSKLYPKIPSLETLQQHGLNVMIIIDGIDELKDVMSITEENVQSSKVNFVKQLLDPRFMKSVRCMVVGRPHVMMQIQEFYRKEFKRQEKTVQICGFNDKSVKSYVNKAFKKSKDASKVLDKIKSSQVTRDLSTIPLYLEILVNIFKDNPFAKTPSTATELLLYNVLIYLRNEKPGKRQSLGRFIETDSTKLFNYITAISKFAFETLETNKIIFEAGESDVLEELVKTGLLLKFYKGETNIISYQFLHLTFQELFASFHILFNDSVIDFQSPILREAIKIATGLQGISCGNYGETDKCVLFSLLQKSTLMEKFKRHIMEEIRNDWTSSNEFNLSGEQLIVDAVFENQTQKGFFSDLFHESWKKFDLLFQCLTITRITFFCFSISS